MLHYDTSTGPLNQIIYSYYGRPNFLDNCDEYNAIIDNNVRDDGLGCTYRGFIRDKELNWIKEDSYCAKYCSIKDTCQYYLENTKALSPEEVERKAIEQATIQLVRGGTQ